MYLRDPNPWDDDPTEKDMPFLYNIEHDPSEKYDIAKDNKDIIDMLQKLSSDHIQSVPRTPSKYDDILPLYLPAYDEYNKK